MRNRKLFSGNEGTRNIHGDVMWAVIIEELIKQQTITVGATATKIPTTPLSKRKILLITNISANKIYIGNSSVTTVDGFPLLPWQSARIDIEDNIDVYGVASGNSEIRILEGA